MKLFLSAICLLILAAGSVFTQKIETEGEMFSQISKLTLTKKDADRDKAYELSKTFLAKFGTQSDDETKKVKEFVENYRTTALGKRIDAGKTAEAFTLGKDFLTVEPENAFVTANLAYAGFQAAQTKKDKTFSQDSVQFAKQTLQLYEAKKLPKSFEPFADEAEATALMYYIVGYFSVDSNLKDAAQNFYKSVQYTSKIKNNSYPYYIIAFSYEKDFEKAAKDFETKHGNQTVQDAEYIADNAKLEKLMGNMMDAYARAIKLGEAEKSASVADWKKRFLEIYKFTHDDSETGSDEYLAKVMATPFPDPNQP
jgi:hypothetical protein